MVPHDHKVWAVIGMYGGVERQAREFERLKPYLSARDWEALVRNTDVHSPDYCLERPDFHHVQTLTICVGHA